MSDVSEPSLEDKAPGTIGPVGGPEEVTVAPPTPAAPGLTDMGGLSIEEVAKEVNAGKWGSGQEQRRRLSEAGYNQYEVRKLATRLRNNL